MAPILTNELIIQPFLPPKTNLPPLIATTKIHPGLLITVLNHPTRSPPPYNPNTTNKTTRPIRNRDLDERRAKDLCFCVMKSLYLGIDARTRNSIPYVLWKTMGKVVRKRE
jgi:hypothetical protein